MDAGEGEVGGQAWAEVVPRRGSTIRVASAGEEEAERRWRRRRRRRRAEARAAPARESVDATEVGERKKDVCSMKMATAAHPLLFTAYIYTINLMGHLRVGQILPNPTIQIF
jgi:hypothetical protein